MTHSLLAAHARRPTKETTRKMTAALQSEVTAVLRKHPAKSRPDHVSAAELRTVAQTALAKAISDLPDDVSDYVHQQISRAVQNTIERPDDFFSGKRPSAIRRGFKRRGDVDAIDGLLDAPDYRDEVTAELAAMFPRCRTKTEKAVLALFELRAPLARIAATVSASVT